MFSTDDKCNITVYTLRLIKHHIAIECIMITKFSAKGSYNSLE